MTFKRLSDIIKEHDIPENVRLMSDSGWECNETEMNGIWYNPELNTIIFTQGNYCEHDNWYDKDRWVLLQGCLNGNYKE